ncbi:unnamed protein product [Callosobruchus maculatus]|uniref:PDZ domain-containing protein n=1 Tax=Callosobruchus maculatus TaxID=64391 RepID=A0A653CBI4_CALMS|nr:unnamed protein product [Callosobruchus maculatus]
MAMNRQVEQRPVWLRVSAEGIGIYERGAPTTASPGGPIAYAHFGWRAIRTLCYSKRYLCILPHKDGDDTVHKQLKKYKLRMEHNKSYFAFRLASLHHQFFLRLRTEYDSLPSLSRQFGVPLKSVKDDANSVRRLESNYRHGAGDGTVNAGTEFDIEFRSSSRTDGLKSALWLSKRFEDDRRLNESIDEERQNNENERPNKDYGSFQSTGIKACSVLTSSSNNVASLCPFDLRADETLGDSLAARLQDASFVDGERRLTAVTLLRKGADRGLGIRIAAGEDGGVYVAAVMLQRAGERDIGPGDQVIAVNGTSLLGVPYERAVQLLQDACGDEVQLMIATERPSIVVAPSESSSESNSGSHRSAEEKYVTESCRDVHNFKKHPPTPPQSVPYHKHIRYEIESDLRCAGTVSTGFKERMEGFPLMKVFSKSCSNLTSSNTAVVVDMIKKQEAEQDVLDNKNAEAFTKVAVPRSFGTGRKWRGPVRYPVTPVRKTTSEATSPATVEDYNVHFRDGHYDGSSVSEGINCDITMI